MERGSSKHSARLDDEMEQEVQGFMTAERPTRAEEWKETEPTGEDQVDPGRLEAPEGLQPGVPAGMTQQDVELRSELGEHLPRSVFPNDESGLLGHLVDTNAPERLQQLVRQLPTGQVYEQLGEVVQALGLHEEGERF
ncbi:MAG TPA: hypothetical protein VGP36_09875 [Mycobacteriales bacterium]|jgi:hypothetical protein|nr:hypothetical protein [Mycobacteriales bacterium]